MTSDPLQLGLPTALPSSPEQAVLDRVANPHPGMLYAARLTCPEFTSLCPANAARRPLSRR